MCDQSFQTKFSISEGEFFAAGFMLVGSFCKFVISQIMCKSIG